MRPDNRHLRQGGFGLVAAMFLIIIIALVIATMAHLATTQNATTSLAIQQARAHQAARAGLEYGVARVLAGQPCGAFDLDGFQVTVTCTAAAPIDLAEEGRTGVLLYSLSAQAEYGAPGEPDYAYRQMTSLVEVP